MDGSTYRSRWQCGGAQRRASILGVRVVISATPHHAHYLCQSNCLCNTFDDCSKVVCSHTKLGNSKRMNVTATVSATMAYVVGLSVRAARALIGDGAAGSPSAPTLPTQSPHRSATQQRLRARQRRSAPHSSCQQRVHSSTRDTPLYKPTVRCLCCCGATGVFACALRRAAWLKRARSAQEDTVRALVALVRRSAPQTAIWLAHALTPNGWSGEFGARINVDRSTCLMRFGANSGGGARRGCVSVRSDSCSSTSSTYSSLIARGRTSTHIS